MRFLTILFLACTLLFAACAEKHSVQMTKSVQELETILSSHVEDIDGMLPELDAYIVKYQPLWDRNFHIFERMNGDDVVRELSTQLKTLDESYLHILNLDLEIQDILRDDPVRLKAYQDRIRRIGRPTAPPGV